MILIRHGQSEFNVHFSRTRIDPGIPDAPLTAEGRRQAADAARRLAGRGLVRLIASPYTRALQTATIIAEGLKLPVAIDPLVRERYAFSCDVGRHRDELARAWPGYDFAHLDHPWWHDIERHGDAESEAWLEDRCTAFRTRMAEDPLWRHTGVVTHWGFIRGLTGHAVPNAAIVEFDPALRRAVVLGA